MIGFFTFLMGLVFVILVLAGGLRWIDTRGRTLERGADPAPELDRLREALERLERRVDDLADEQRFLERLLSERPAPDALPPGRDRQRPGTAADSGDRPAADRPDSILFDVESDEERAS